MARGAGETFIGDWRGARGPALPGGVRARFRFVWTTLEALRLASAGLRANKLRSGLPLVGVTERTKEIGVRKAVGATRGNILWQFPVEAAVLTGVGGALGLAAGEAAGLLTNPHSPPPAYVPLWAIVVGLGISAGVGPVFGLRPAWKAARLDPIQALRYE